MGDSGIQGRGDQFSQLERYARHHLIDWWDQDRLSQSRVLIAGAGALGNEVAKNLVLVGVGYIDIVDFDEIEESNLARTVFFDESDIGKWKAEVLAQKCRELNPHIEINGINGDVELDLGSWAYKSYDVVLSTVDSIDARLAINSRCMQAGVPWINGGMGAVAGEVALFTPDSACFQCTMSPDMWKRRNQRFSCGGLRSLLPGKKVATTATVSSLVGSIMSQEALSLLHGTPKRKRGLTGGTRLFFQVSPYTLSVGELVRDPNCTAHDIVLDRPSPISRETTLGELLERQDAYVELNIDILGHLACDTCGRSDRILTPAKRFDTSILKCPNCGSERRADIFNVIDKSMAEMLSVPLGRLSLPRSHLISVRCGTERKFFVTDDHYSTGDVFVR